MARPRKISPMPQEGEQTAREVEQPTQEQVERPAERRKRVPLGGARQKLIASKRPGFHRHWMNDDRTRITDALQAGYEFVRKDGQANTTDMGEAISQVVGTKEGGQPLKAYLMEIREEWYREDQDAKQETVNAVESEIRKGELQGKIGEDGRYLPSAGIKLPS